MKHKILISDSMHECIIDMLHEASFEVDYLPKITRQEIIDSIHEYTGIVVRSKTFIDRELLLPATNLRFIARAGAGVDQIDIDFTEERGITILNAPEGNRDAVAEHTIGMLLNLVNHLRKADIEVRQKIWDREGNRGIEIMGRTVGIIGYGNMGEAVARRLHGFGCNIIAYDKYKSGFGNEIVQEVDMETFFRNAEIVSFHVPLTEETRMYVNDSFIERFEKDIILLNSARGEIMPIKTLLKYLKNGKIVAAGIDVLENEKMRKLNDEQNKVMSELFTLNNVIFTPHVAGWTKESYIKISQTLANKIIALKLD